MKASKHHGKKLHPRQSAELARRKARKLARRLEVVGGRCPMGVDEVIAIAAMLPGKLQAEA